MPEEPLDPRFVRLDFTLRSVYRDFHERGMPGSVPADLHKPARVHLAQHLRRQVRRPWRNRIFVRPLFARERRIAAVRDEKRRRDLQFFQHGEKDRVVVRPSVVEGEARRARAAARARIAESRERIAVGAHRLHKRPQLPRPHRIVRAAWINNLFADAVQHQEGRRPPSRPPPRVPPRQEPFNIHLRPLPHQAARPARPAARPRRPRRAIRLPPIRA